MICNQILAIIIRNLKLSIRSCWEILSILVGPILTIIALFITRLAYLTTENEIAKNEIAKIFSTIILPSAILVSITGYQRSLIVFLVNERKAGFRENHTVMGLKYVSYVLGNLIYSSSLCIFSIVLVIIGCFTVTFMSVTAFKWAMIPVVFLFAISAVLFVMCFSRILNHPEIASDFSTLIILLSITIFIISINGGNFTIPLLYAFSWVPQINVLTSIVFVSETATLTGLIFYQLGNCIFYFFLYLYFERVLPNEFGKRDSSLFFLKGNLNNQLGQQDVTYFIAQTKKLPLRYQSFKVNLQLTMIGLWKKQEKNKERDDTLIESKDGSSALIYEESEIFNEYKKIYKLLSVSKQYGRLPVLSEISFYIPDNAIIALLGPNGAGKTTLINILCGVIPPTHGKVLMNDIDIFQNWQHLISKIGICPQTNILYENLTILEHLSYIRRVKGVDKKIGNEQIDHIIHLLGLKEWENKKVKILSGGTKRKVCLAMALVGKPEVILLDEPSSGMDIKSRKEFWTIIKSLKKEGLAILLTTQHLEEAEELADQTIILSKGLILVQGSNRFIENKFAGSDKMTIRMNPQSKNSFNIQQLVSEHYPKAKILENSEKLVRLDVNVHDQEFLNLIRKIEELQNELEFSIRKKSLEDAFINLGEDPLSYLQQEGVILNEKDLEKFKLVFDPKPVKFEKLIKEKTKWKFISGIYSIIKKRILISFLSTKNIILFLLPCFISILICMIVYKIDYAEESSVEIWDLNRMAMVFNIIVISSIFLTTVFYVYQIVREKEEGLRILLRTAGLNAFAYWCGHMIADILLFGIQISIILLLCIVPILIPLAKHLEATNEISSNYTFTVFSTMASSFFMFGFIFISISYLKSRVFSRKISALRFFNFFLSFIFGGIFSFFLLLLLRTNGIVIFFVCSAILNPFVALGIVMTSRFDDYYWEIQKFPIEAYITCYGFIIFFLNILIEDLLFVKVVSTHKLDPSETIHQNEILRVTNLTKNYSLKNMSIQAPNVVSNLSFNVLSGRVYALLGPNGAGKSTIFGMISSQLKQTSGEIIFNNEKIRFKRDIIKIRPIIGVCEQRNIFWEDLTVYQNLSIFADIKGYWFKSKKKYLKIIMKSFILTSEKKKLCKELSGGNKRKLCMAIAFMENPSLIILDEPTAGVDPIARRFFRKIISNFKEQLGTSILLTSHSIEEVEGLADDIGIIVKGSMKIEGNLEELKRKCGCGYKIQIKITDQLNNNQILAEIFEKFENPSLIPGPQPFEWIFRVESMKCSKILQQLHEMSRNGIIEYFSICNSSLEQIFMMQTRPDHYHFSPQYLRIQNESTQPIAPLPMVNIDLNQKNFKHVEGNEFIVHGNENQPMLKVILNKYA